MIVLAIDVSLSSSGYCIITDKKEILKYGKVGAMPWGINQIR